MPRSESTLSPEHARRIGNARRRAEQWTAELDQAVRGALDAGEPAAAVARALGVSRQALHDRFAAPRRRGESPDA